MNRRTLQDAGVRRLVFFAGFGDSPTRKSAILADLVCCASIYPCLRDIPPDEVILILSAMTPLQGKQGCGISSYLGYCFCIENRLKNEFLS